ncbi:MAG TPA: N-6 DNA methylase [Mucilaginibacter sp.]|jgi:methylase of polypeptide subunit release factors
MEKTDKIFSELGLNLENGLFLTKEERWRKEISFPNRVKRLLERKIEPDAFFCFDNKPLILFFENPTNIEKLHEAIWNFNECPIAIIIQNEVIEIFNGFNFLKDKKLLEKLGGAEKLNHFTYFELVTGRTWEQYQKQLDYKNRVDYHLLQNIKAARKSLLGQDEHKAKLLNAILGKVIFVRYLIDRKVNMKFDGKFRTWSNQEFCKLLDDPNEAQQFFEYLDDKDRGFNGDLFPLTTNEYRQITANDYQIIKRLLQGEDIEQSQPSLFEFYDFSIIPIEFISNVYELFIGGDNQKKEGAYYTPLFLVDYILKQTVEKKITKKGGDHNCKVLDPACGSGIFLVETLRKIVEKFSVDTGIDVKSEKFKTAIKNLAQENLYGIDKDLSAVQVAIFSIYLTLLDYLEPPGIETFKFPVLFNTNFFQADFFNEDLPFNKHLKEIHFDFILGNPPWSRGKGEEKKPLYIQYIEKRKKREKVKEAPEIEVGNREIAQAFLLRSSDFSKDKTKIALIVTSKVLYNLQSILFRKYFLNHFFIEKIFELAPVRREVFDKSNDKAIAPACVLFYRYANGINTDSNIIEHIALKPSRFFSLFKIFTINRTDYKNIQQVRLKEFDWLWKVLVYGSYLDFNFLKRLKDGYKSINNYFEQNEVLIKQGIKRKDGTKKIDVSELVGWDFLDLNKKQLQQLYINPKHEKWDITEVGYVFRENGVVCKDIFSPPVLLVKETVNTKLETVSAVSFQNIIFTDKTTSIKFLNSNDVDNYYVLAGLMNSTLFAYYILNISSTAGIMIEQQINDSERFDFPYLYSETLIRFVKEIENFKKENQNDILLNDEKSQDVKTKTERVNELIYNLFDVNETERALINYAENITIPISMRHEGFDRLFKPLSFENAILKEYAEIFIERFKSKLEDDENKFIAEIWYTGQIVGMFFKMIPASEYTKNVIWFDKQNSDLAILSLLIKISSEKVTEKLFVQKDVRGFEKDYFYIFKPNEKRLWHRAIGYLDVNEFADAMLKAGRDGK